MSPAEGLDVKAWSTVLTWSRTGWATNWSQLGTINGVVWHPGTSEKARFTCTGKPGRSLPVWSHE